MENRIKGGRNGERIALEENTREGGGEGRRGRKRQGKQSSGAARVKNKKPVGKREKRGRKERSMSMESLQWNRRFDAARSYFTSAIRRKRGVLAAENQNETREFRARFWLPAFLSVSS